jgi:Fe-S-cluster-containing hydrogenase component 2
VNIRELGGWSSEKSTPKIAALIAMAALPEPEPAPAVEFKSQGQVLVIGPAAVALDWAERLSGQLEVSVLATMAGASFRSSAIPGVVRQGHQRLGLARRVRSRMAPENPIDLEVCTRCNACIRACPEDAIGFDYQVDLAKCKDHRDCVKACGSIGAIDFSRTTFRGRTRSTSCSTCRARRSSTCTELPQGYLAPGDDPLEQALAAQKLAGLVGEFEKPKFFQYRRKNLRAQPLRQAGLQRCIDVCSSGAISADGDPVKIESHLCAGCGGCARSARRAR